MDSIRMDSHKLLYHPCEVARWVKGDMIYPIEIEIGLSGACNHRCIFCAVDYMDYKPTILDADTLIKNIEVMAGAGVKSIIYAGDGEPMVNPRATEIIRKTKENKIDVAMSTNGVLFTEEKVKDCLGALTWVRYSIAGATDKTYEKIHQCRAGDLQRVLDNMTAAVKEKVDKNLDTTLGAQLLLLPENKDEVLALGKMVKEIGFDYFTVKPFSQHPASKAKLQVDYSEAKEVGKELSSIQTDSFKVYFRSQSIENLDMEKPYHNCYGVHFMTYIDSRGDVFPCVVFMGDETFKYGNIYKRSFDAIWASDRSKQIRDSFDRSFILKNCRKNCRLDEMNKYLEELRFPKAHINFI